MLYPLLAIGAGFVIVRIARAGWARQAGAAAAAVLLLAPQRLDQWARGLAGEVMAFRSGNGGMAGNGPGSAGMGGAGSRWSVPAGCRFSAVGPARPTSVQLPVIAATAGKRGASSLR
jgi:hypothetical protein